MFYLVPLALALYFSLVLVTPILLILFLFSVAFHVSGEREFVCSDAVSAVMVVVSNVTLLYLSEFNLLVFSTVLVLTGITLGIRFVIERNDRGGLAHGFWHIIAAAITSVCVLSYTLPL